MIYQRPPLRPRQMLAFEGQAIGSVEAAVAQQLCAHGLLAADGAGWRVTAPFPALADTLREAGLRLDQLQGLTHAGHVLIRRPSGGADAVGYTVEWIDWYSATLPEGALPENQDGEVERFDCVGTESLRADIAARVLHPGGRAHPGARSHGPAHCPLTCSRRRLGARAPAESRMG